MSSEIDHPRQLTVAELMAAHGDAGGTGRRRRRREAESGTLEPGDGVGHQDDDAASEPTRWTPDRSVLRDPVPPDDGTTGWDPVGVNRSANGSSPWAGRGAGDEVSSAFDDHDPRARSGGGGGTDLFDHEPINGRSGGGAPYGLIPAAGPDRFGGRGESSRNGRDRGAGGPDPQVRAPGAWADGRIDPNGRIDPDGWTDPDGRIDPDGRTDQGGRGWSAGGAAGGPGPLSAVDTAGSAGARGRNGWAAEGETGRAGGPDAGANWSSGRVDRGVGRVPASDVPPPNGWAQGGPPAGHTATFGDPAGRAGGGPQAGTAYVDPARRNGGRPPVNGVHPGRSQHGARPDPGRSRPGDPTPAGPSGGRSGLAPRAVDGTAVFSDPAADRAQDTARGALPPGPHAGAARPPGRRAADLGAHSAPARNDGTVIDPARSRRAAPAGDDRDGPRTQLSDPVDLDGERLAGTGRGRADPRVDPSDLHVGNPYVGDPYVGNPYVGDPYGADPHGVDVHRADLERADLERADLERADLERADLRRTELRGPDPRGPDPRGADLRGADPRGAAPRGADPYATDLDGDHYGVGLADADHEAPAELRSRRTASRSSGRAWVGVVAQWIVGAIGGAALWIGFRFLWQELTVVAIAAAVLVTVGLVLVVRHLLRNDDRRTTVFAVLIGLLLTVSPALLVLLHR